MTSPCRVETFSKHNVTVFRDNFEALHFARQVAAIKNIQTDCRPFYVMNIGRVNQLLDAWYDFLPRVCPFYSVNCNADDVLLKVIADRADVGLHCQTRQNLDKALEHVGPENILYSNACWTRSATAHAAANDVRRLSFESARDLSRIVAGLNGASPASLELVLNVCVNGLDEENDDGFADVDTEATFGCSLADAPDLLQLAADMYAPCIGVAFTLGYAGGGGGSMTRCYERAIAEMARLFTFARQIGTPLRLLNIGGDFSARDNDHVSFAKVCAQINESLEFHFPRDDFTELAIIATPGRFVAESAFTLVTNVTGRRSVDASYITNDDFDAGTEAFIYETNEGYYGSFGCRINANCNPSCSPLFDGEFESKDEHVYSKVLGPTCDERFDLLQSGCHFRPLHVGEWLMWADMGAYTLNNRVDDDFDCDAAPNLPPAIFYFTSQSDWRRLNSISNGIFDEDASVPPPSFYRDYSSNVGGLSDDDDEGIRSASPSSLVSAEISSADCSMTSILTRGRDLFPGPQTKNTIKKRTFFSLGKKPNISVANQLD